MKCYKLFKEVNGKLISINACLPTGMVFTYNKEEPNIAPGDTEFYVFKDAQAAREWFHRCRRHPKGWYQLWEVNALRPKPSYEILNLGSQWTLPWRLSDDYIEGINRWWGHAAQQRPQNISFWFSNIILSRGKPPAGTYTTKQVRLVKQVEL